MQRQNPTYHDYYNIEEFNFNSNLNKKFMES